MEVCGFANATFVDESSSDRFDILCHCVIMVSISALEHDRIWILNEKHYKCLDINFFSHTFGIYQQNL